MPTKQITLTERETTLILALRKAEAVPPTCDSAWPMERERGLMLTVALLLDGYAVGFARQVLQGAAKVSTGTARFSPDSGWVQQEAQEPPDFRAQSN